MNNKEIITEVPIALQGTYKVTNDPKIFIEKIALEWTDYIKRNL